MGEFKMFKTTVRTKKCVICSIPLIVAYLAFVHPILLRNEFQQTILDTECKPVWDFLADFSNYQTLNPEVKYFEILDESHGKDGKWTYGVHYVEYFEHLPDFFENSAIGRYTVSSNEEVYTIESEHITCMIPILNWFCLKTSAKDTLEPWHQDCLVKEEINFECPLLFIPLCRAEVQSQRSKVMDNLQYQTFDNED